LAEASLVRLKKTIGNKAKLNVVSRQVKVEKSSQDHQKLKQLLKYWKSKSEMTY